MQITAARVTEQGVSFTVLLVKSGAIQSAERDTIGSDLPLDFPRPIVLAEQTGQGMNYYGRDDIANFLSNLDPSQIPWQDFEIS